MFFWNKKKEKPKKIKKLSSIAFVIAIPANFLLGAICFLASMNMLTSGQYRSESLLAFVGTFVLSFLLMRKLELSRLRVFLHESKHALLVLLSGNIVKGFTVQQHEGEVEYQMYKNRQQFGPFITLAPYCFPLFALPAFVVTFLLDRDPTWGQLCAAGLGLAFAIDMETAFHDLHPHQTDFKQIIGGFPASGLYIASVMFLAGMGCFLLVLGGREGLASAVFVAIALGLSFAEKLPFLLRQWSH